jgi:hypothetical protein
LEVFRALTSRTSETKKEAEWALQTSDQGAHMRARFAGLAAMSIVVLAGSVTLPNLTAQDKAKVQAGQNVQGTVVDISKDKSMITIRTSSSATRLVAYNSSTKFLYGHSNDSKPGSIAQLKASFYISCAAGLDAKKDLTATECVYRETK